MNTEKDQRRTPLAKPADERTADQSTQKSSGLHGRPGGVRPGPGPELADERDADDVLDRSAEARYETPRRYENEGDDTVMPANDSTLNTKI